MEREIRYEQIKQIVENTPDALWTPQVPKNKELMDRIRKTLKPMRISQPRPQRRLQVKQVQNHPNELDWRYAAPQCDLPVRNQANCGSCWAFATVASFSIRKCIAKNESEATQYSEQFMISCDLWEDGCAGGYVDTAQDFLVTTGIVPDACVSYQSENGQAPACPTTCDDGSELPPRQYASAMHYLNEYSVAMEGIQRGPFTTLMTVYEDFMVYQSGIYHHVYGNLIGNHAISIVGYGVDENDVMYWIARNSWGSWWGENGYFRIIRSFNECSIESLCYELLF